MQGQNLEHRAHHTVWVSKDIDQGTVPESNVAVCARPQSRIIHGVFVDVELVAINFRGYRAKSMDVERIGGENLRSVRCKTVPNWRGRCRRHLAKICNCDQRSK